MRILETEHTAALGRAKRRTTLRVTFGSGDVARWSTADTTVGEQVFLGKIRPGVTLNQELTESDEGAEIQVTNATHVLGQNLINTADALTGGEAMVGTYFYDPETGGEWLDDKVPGILEQGDIDGEWINIYFKDKASASLYNGVSIASLFPDEEIPLEEIPAAPAPGIAAPVFDDIGINKEAMLLRRIRPLNSVPEGNHFLPEDLFFEKSFAFKVREF